MSVTANSRYMFEILSSDELAAHPKSGLKTIVVSGSCTNADGISFDFIATNNLDQRYPDRFKVNWNGKAARMPEVVGFGIAEDVRTGRKVTEDLYFTRGARIAIARKCKSLFPLWKQAEVKASDATDVSAFTYNESLNR